MTLVGSPTSIGSYTFVVRAKAYENHTNSRGESTVDVTVTYVVSNVNTSSSTTTRAPAAISIDYPSSVVQDAPFTWTIINGANDVNFYATGSTWNGGRTPGSGTLPTITGSTYTKNNNGINTNYTPIEGYIPTPGTYYLTFHFSNGQTVSKTVTVTAPSTTTTTTTTTPTPITYNPIIRFVPSALSFNVDPNSTLIINVRSDTTYQIEVIGMKPNGSFYFSLGDFLGSPAYRWNTQPIFSAKGIDPNNIQADINGHWSMNITIPAGTDVEPNGYMRIAGFGSKDPNVNITPNDVFMYVTK
jgi:hypothetical protein